MIGQQIRKHRRAKDITQKELANKAGLSVTHLSQIENDESFPGKQKLASILDALGLELRIISKMSD